jgi:NDP-sugar pyrophosphorylase family protein
MGSFLFSGIYLVSPGFFRFLESGKIESVVEAFLRAIEETQGSIGGVVVDENFWYDLGTPPEWEEVNRAVDSGEIILEGKG